MDTTKIISLIGLSMIFFWIYLSMRRTRTLPMRHAAERLFEAFMDEIQVLSDGRGDAYKILKKAFPRHENAYLHFRSHINGRVLKKFDEAWEDYSCRGTHNPASLLEQYSAPGNGTDGREKRQLALKKILTLLAVARGYSNLPPR